MAAGLLSGQLLVGHSRLEKLCLCFFSSFAILMADFYGRVEDACTQHEAGLCLQANVFAQKGDKNRGEPFQGCQSH